MQFLESEKENNTKALFKYYDVKPDASFNEIYSILAKMDRKDCLAVLQTAYASMYYSELLIVDPQLLS